MYAWYDDFEVVGGDSEIEGRRVSVVVDRN